MFKHDRIVRRHVRVRYLVTVRSDEGFEGVLTDADDQTIVLDGVFQVSPDGTRQGVVGRLFIPRSTVKYMQTIQA